MIRVQDIALTLEEEESALQGKIAKKLHIQPKDIKSYRIFKKAIDARKKNAIKIVYTVDIETTKEAQILRKHPDFKTPDLTYYYPEMGTKEMKHRPVVVGSGPCGMFAALILAQMGYKPIVLERGKDVDERVKDMEAFWKDGVFKSASNVQFGEGGAGTFSDGKLTTQIKNVRCHKVLQEFARFGAPEEICYKNKPHIGTDILRSVVKNIRHEIERLGGTYRFESQLTGFKVEENELKQIEVNHEEWIDADVCILALGHSARDTFKLLYETGLTMIQKPFAMGMRIEHLQEWINESQYGVAHHDKLGAAEYKLVHHASNGRAVYTFCMCPGGYVVASASEDGGVVTNGMSEYARDAENANSALLVNIGPDDFGSDDPLAGVELQRKLEKLAYELGGRTYKAPLQTVGDFLRGETTTKLGAVKPTYEPGVVFSNMRKELPNFMSEAIVEALGIFGKKIKNFDHEDALLTGFETRSSSPVRMPRNENYEGSIKGLYPAGEGAGYAGGITSAGVDGIEVAEAIIKVYKNFN
ncbi:NAD(P)/FAD-dependent oxidoreductase [Zhenhengia yiwuensis]|uniref:NAD(P)/FAD-dependent oxidoreductase n=1 Tax=Zhenhengia yiwuensis TaxID=2763666 RepID=UPI002A755C32|nr:hypothetical protein [Zhenhengia yiwuensis]MDY3367080.1 hypothetical protein [Zhenhengia yiwuensis]